MFVLLPLLFLYKKRFIDLEFGEKGNKQWKISQASEGWTKYAELVHDRLKYPIWPDLLLMNQASVLSSEIPSTMTVCVF